MNSNRLENDLTETELSMGRRFSLGVLDSLPANIAVIAEDGTIITANKAWAEFAAKNGNPIVQCTSIEAKSLELTNLAAGSDSDRQRSIDAGIKAVLHGSLPEFKLEYSVHQCSQRHWFQLHMTPLAAMGQKAVVVMHTDISAQKTIECRAKDYEERCRLLLEAAKGYDVVLLDAALRSVVDHTIDALVTVDQHGVIQSFAGAAQKVFGYQASEAVGQKVNMLMPDPWRSEHDTYMQNYLRTGDAKIIGIGREVTGQRKDGSVFPLDLTVTSFLLGDRRFFTGILRDITERKAAQEQLQVQATRDALTGSWNRATVLELLNKELNRSRREQRHLGLIFVDLDHFKQINDTYGHQAGDAVLRSASEKMSGVMRPYDLVGRYGGEEFLIVLPGCEESNLWKVCERLRKCLEETLVVYEQKVLSFTVSIGATIAIPAQQPDVESLIRSADLAMYRAKTGGRNRVEFATT